MRGADAVSSPGASAPRPGRRTWVILGGVLTLLLGGTASFVALHWDELAARAQVLWCLHQLDSSDRNVRYKAIGTLRRLILHPDDRPIEGMSLDPGTLRDDIVPRIADDDMWVRMHAAILLSSHLDGSGDRTTVPDLVAMLDHPRSYARLRAADLLVMLHAAPPDTADRLAPTLEDPDPQVRASAVWILADLACPDALDRIRPFLRDPNGDVRRSAVISAARFGDPSVTDEIGGLLRNPIDESYRLRLLELISSPVCRGLVPQVAALLGKVPPDTRDAVATALERMTGIEFESAAEPLTAEQWWESHKNDPEWRTSSGEPAPPATDVPR